MTKRFVTGSNGKPTIDKPRGATLEYAADFTDSLAAISDSISTATVEASTGLTLSSVSYTTTKVSFVLAGGSVGTVEWATITATTSNAVPKVLVQTLYFNITPR